MFDFTEERELIEYRAEKNQKKLQERGDKVGEFKPESVNHNSFEDQMELFRKGRLFNSLDIWRPKRGYISLPRLKT